MAETNTAGIDIVARLDAFRAEMAKIPDIGGKEAKALTAQLSKEIKANSRELNALAKAAKAGGSAVDDSSKAARKALAAFGPLGGVLARLSPEAGAASSSIAALTSAVGGLGPVGASAAAVVATAVGGVVAVYAQWREEQDQLNRIIEIAKEGERDRLPILDSTRDAMVRLQVAVGSLSEEEGRLAENANKVFDAYEKAIAGPLGRLAEITKAQASFTTQMADGFLAIVPTATVFSAAIDALTTDSRELSAEAAALAGEIGKTTVATAQNAEVTAAAIAADEAKKRSVEALAKAEKAGDAAAAARRKEAEDAVKKTNDAFDARLANAEASMEFDERVAKEAAEAEDKAFERAMKHTEELRAKRLEAAKERVRNERIAQDSVSGILSIGADFAMDLSQDLTDKQKQGARTAFAIAQGIAVAEATLTAALAISRAFADYPYPASLGVAALAGASAGAALANVAMTPAPSFNDTPGVQKMGTTGTVQLAGNDYFAAAKDPQDLRRQVGASDSGRHLSARADDRWMRDHLRTNGTLAKKIRGNERTGHGP